MEPSPAATASMPAGYPVVAVANPTKVSGRRFGAYLVDAFVLGAIVPVAIFFAVSRPTIYTDGPSCGFLEARDLVPSGHACLEVTGSGGVEGTWVMSASGYIAAAIYLLVFLIAIEWLLQATTGMTIGKLLFGIRTVNTAGSGPGLGRQLIRALLWIVDGIALILPIAAWSILFTKRNQRLGDLVAGTFVVRSSARGTPVPDISAVAAVGTAPAPGLDPSGTIPGAFPSSPPTDATAYPPNAPMVAPAPAAMAPPQDLTTVHLPTDEPTVVQPVIPGATDGDPTVADGMTPAIDAPPAPDSTTDLASNPATEAPAPEQPGPAQQRADTAQPGATGGPQWDPARNAYIQWDPNQATWLVYDDAAAAWKPII